MVILFFSQKLCKNRDLSSMCCLSTHYRYSHLGIVTTIECIIIVVIIRISRCWGIKYDSSWIVNVIFDTFSVYPWNSLRLWLTWHQVVLSSSCNSFIRFAWLLSNITISRLRILTTDNIRVKEIFIRLEF